MGSDCMVVRGSEGYVHFCLWYRILEELPKNMSEVRAQEGAHVLHRATTMAGGDRL